MNIARSWTIDELAKAVERGGGDADLAAVECRERIRHLDLLLASEGDLPADNSGQHSLN